MAHRGTGMEQLCRAAVPDGEDPDHDPGYQRLDIHTRIKQVPLDVPKPAAERGMFVDVLPGPKGTCPEPGSDGSCMWTGGFRSCLVGRSPEQEAARQIDRSLLEATLEHVSMLIKSESEQVCANG